MFVFSIFNITSVLASSNVLKINSLQVTEKSNVDVDVNYSNDSVFNNVVFHGVNDYVIYKLSFMNLTNKNYTIKDITDNSNSYVFYDYDKHKGEIIKANGSFELSVKISYKTEVADLSSGTKVSDRTIPSGNVTYYARWS